MEFGWDVLGHLIKRGRDPELVWCGAQGGKVVVSEPVLESEERGAMVEERGARVEGG